MLLAILAELCLQCLSWVLVQSSECLVVFTHRPHNHNTQSVLTGMSILKLYVLPQKTLCNLSLRTFTACLSLILSELLSHRWPMFSCLLFIMRGRLCLTMVSLHHPGEKLLATHTHANTTRRKQIFHLDVMQTSWDSRSLHVLNCLKH